ncbi:hypothetical protein GGX14DRAFT_577072 [Mycena pura]|uniref:Uncharacterized protein n=1 Tax=Mycena pura TaxID=153505 RepID=A0AAD6UZE8_9AGAR|nr:hypothetical protein GGX14DRAFT_577072 [Mycena pura]
MSGSRPGDQFYEETNAAIEYAGNWTHEPGAIYHGAAHMSTQQLGASVSVTFHGSAILVLGAMGWNHSTFALTLDRRTHLVDAACCMPAGGIAQTVHFAAAHLDTQRAHVLTITNRAAGPGGSVLALDAFIIRAVPQTPPLVSESTPARSLQLGVLIVTLGLVFALVVLVLRRYRHRKQDIDDTVLPMMPQTRSDVLLAAEGKSGALLPLWCLRRLRRWGPW